ncbi:RNA polymerase sigma-70 factor, ECF subfamily [Tistlia consotensis]|uniref:RNA polymerase sigma-70 factor, ECF subfamily n=1 Tax=Tistlia consotensis USBA 355 TaxID=560819 RepID=A0A1Y6BMC6_9PROT|nr:sigma-70 family RNA polymerase sigma factor [Tistlia consotensis]SMF14755.1 RNA polymerase sigma-70 factor, ECF subfamily [Tistlia consotensis USBA 355]SNR49265.1 RNA polymerase sigma-70 factor, ECF subfamily [Tistlia consotensis]
MRQAIIEEIPHLRRFARGLLRDVEAADDLVQDCIVRALTKEALYDPERSLRAWLFTLLRNLFVSRLRSARLRHERPLEEGDAEPGVAAGQTEQVLARQMLALLQRLPAEQREVLLLVSVEELTYRETAEILGIPPGTVMSRLARGREALRRLQQEADAPPLRRVK